MHLTGEMFALATGTRLTHVPYKGSAQALNDLLGGQIDSMFGDLLVVLPQVQAGKLRALAVSARTRHPMFAATPTFIETGLADFEALSWQGVFAPAHTPAPVLERLNAEIVKAVQASELRGFFAERGFVVEGHTLEESRRFVDAEVAKWARIVQVVKPVVS
jgi:tripartite-type tricarboxylate transporter receptor subunit TctC